MLRVALTGNIGSGKSTVAQIFNVFGIKVFNADVEARNLYNDKNVIQLLTAVFTNIILSPSGEIDKRTLATIIFSDKIALKKINSIIHPLVVNKYNEWCTLNKDDRYTIHESAIIFENKLQEKFDFIINVSAPVNIRIQRVMDRDNIPEIDVRKRVKNQLSDEEKCNLSHFVIINDEKRFLTPQVQLIHKTLLSYSQ